MRKQVLIDALKRDPDVSRKLSAIRQLQGFLDDVDVVRALCFVSLQTDSHELRLSIINALESISSMVNPYFTHMAMNAKCATLRKWALVNLSMMGCKDAKTAVIKGLRDTSGAVQEAAALNIGLYHDAEFLQEVELFFERNTFDPLTFRYAARKHSASRRGGYAKSYSRR